MGSCVYTRAHVSMNAHAHASKPGTSTPSSCTRAPAAADMMLEGHLRGASTSRLHAECSTNGSGTSLREPAGLGLHGGAFWVRAVCKDGDMLDQAYENRMLAAVRCVRSGPER